jgi:hypothetical protein
MRMLHLELRVSNLEQSLAFYTALGYAELGRVPETEFGSLTMILPIRPSRTAFYRHSSTSITPQQTETEGRVRPILAASVDDYLSLLTIEVKGSWRWRRGAARYPAVSTLHPSPSGADVVVQAE